MKIATWNVNSVRARQERVLTWLELAQPDIVCLQELKAVAADFPTAEVEVLGYHSAVHGQPTYNGVAILARSAITGVARGFDDGVDDPQARLIAATVGGIRVLSAYIPNGAEVGSEKYSYKLAWLDRLASYLERHVRPDGPTVLCGDFNIARDERDANEPDKWRGSVLLNEELSARLAQLLDWGFVDTVRQHHPDGGVYSWWDYRRLGFPRNDGLRLDHILATMPLAASCTAAYVDRDQRKGPKPSDHAPVIAVFES